jgi:hypothetical protein
MFDVRQQQFLVLFLVIQPQLDAPQRLFRNLAFEQLVNRIIDMPPVAQYLP